MIEEIELEKYSSQSLESVIQEDEIAHQIPSETDILLDALEELALRHGKRAGLYIGQDIIGVGVVDILDENTAKVASPYDIRSEQPYLESQDENEFYAFDVTVIRYGTQIQPRTDWILTTPQATFIEHGKYRLRPPENLQGRVSIVPWKEKTDYIVSLEKGMEIEGLGTIEDISTDGFTVSDTFYTSEELVSLFIKENIAPPPTYKQSNPDSYYPNGDL